MKKIRLSIIALLFTCSLFAVSSTGTNVCVLVATAGLIGSAILVRKNQKENQPALLLQPVSK
ncbi:MAG TPA: hypothetical protein VIM55_17590 [Mucilaginibacter sp.]